MTKNTAPFFGREYELGVLNNLFNKRSASLVICRGRRRIGKSTLIQKFGAESDVFVQFQGLPPRKGGTAREQLDAFSEQLSRQTTVPRVGIDSWDKAFFLLGGQVKKEARTVILFDEISWMAADAPDFAGYLKIAWDTLFTSFPSLVLVLCGSVSSWIEKNILNNTGFVGRVSVTLTLEQLPLHTCNRFWGPRTERVSSYEKLRFLAVCGGVPRYLKEVVPAEDTALTVRRLCFTPDGMLFNEFEQIFHDIFSRRADIYRTIAETLSDAPCSQSQIAALMDKERSGYLGACLSDLELSGFIRKFDIGTLGYRNRSRLHQYRIIDNYLRFYLKYVAPLAVKIRQGLYRDAGLESVIPWDTVLGIQFETLVINNLITVLRLLQIDPVSVLRAGPYMQRVTNRTQACQVDLLIETRHTVFVGEIKCRRAIGADVIDEVAEKMARLRPPAGKTMRPFLVCEGAVGADVAAGRFFDRIITFADMLAATV